MKVFEHVLHHKPCLQAGQGTTTKYIHKPYLQAGQGTKTNILSYKKIRIVKYKYILDSDVW